MRLREDLWKIAAQLKQHQGFACAAAPIAKWGPFGVGRTWYQELGWRHAREHLQQQNVWPKSTKLADNCFCPPEEKPCPMLVAEETPKAEQPKDKMPFLWITNHFALSQCAA